MAKAKKLPEVVQNAILSGPVPKMRDWRKLSIEKLTRAEKVMLFAESYLLVPEGAKVGQPLKLEAFQEAFIYAIFDNPAGTRRAIFSIGRKNGKTALSAVILLAFICGPVAIRNSMICSGAMGREQAGLVFKHMRKMIEMSEKLTSITRIIPSQKQIIGLTSGVEFTALAKEGSTTVGRSDRVILGDEWGQIIGESDSFVDALTTSQGAHDDALQIIISTQAATDAAMLSTWIDDANNSKDPKVVCHVYSAKQDADVLDQKGWKASNPALGLFRSLEDLKNQAEEASRMPSKESSFRNLILNQRVATTSPLISRNVWESCGEASLLSIDEEFDGPVYGGLDLSAKTDLTSLVLVGKKEGKWNVLTIAWTPRDTLYDREKKDRVPYSAWVNSGYLRSVPGPVIDLDFVAEEIKDIIENLDLRAIAYDRWRIDVFKKSVERAEYDLPLIECGQGFKDMSPAIDALETALLKEEIRHGMHPVLTMCAANAVADSDPAGNRKLVKKKATGRIDCLVALAMAMKLATEEAEGDVADGPSVYEDRGLLVL